MSSEAVGYDPDPDDDEDDDGPDEYGDDDPDEGDDDDDEGDDDDDEGDDEPEDARAARATRVEPAAVPVAAAATVSQPAARITSSRDPRSRIRPLSDPRVSQLVILDRNSRRLSQLHPPFPEPIDQWIAATYGAGKYRLVQRDDRGKHIGSRTVTVEGKTVALGAIQFQPTVPTNGNGHAVADPQPPTIHPGTDWRLALVTAGLPIVAGAVNTFAQAMARRNQPSELEILVKAAELLKVPNEERTAIFREGLKLAETLAQRPSESSESPFPLRELLQGVADVVQSFRAAQPAAAAAAPAPGAIAARTSAPVKPAAPAETPEQFVERVLFAEIQRAVGAADSPECFVILLDAWLPQVVTWIELTDEEEVLAELPKRYPERAEYLAQPTVQAFLRSALRMIHEDKEQGAEEESGAVHSGDGDPAL